MGGGACLFRLVPEGQQLQPLHGRQLAGPGQDRAHHHECQRASKADVACPPAHHTALLAHLGRQHACQPAICHQGPRTCPSGAIDGTGQSRTPLTVRHRHSHRGSAVPLRHVSRESRAAGHACNHRPGAEKSLPFHRAAVVDVHHICELLLLLPAVWAASGCR